MSLRSFQSIEERRLFLEKKTGKVFSSFGFFPKELRVAEKKNCENMIGAISVPLGVAGPLKVKGSYADGAFYLPLATTEGALVASVNRGCKAITLSGGATIMSQNSGMTRGPVFRTKNILESASLASWVVKKKEKLASIAKQTSRHLTLLDTFTRFVGKNVFIRFSFATDDAMGMNMVTYATESIVRFTERETGASCVALAGNFDVDKKPAWLNVILGRGKQVWAEVVLPDNVVNEVLKSSTEKIHEVCTRKCQLGSIMSGSMGFNAHAANVIAAMFIASGQDVAHVSEGSTCITTTEREKEGLRISIYLPDLATGTVGGGTGLPSQKASLSLLDIEGGNKGKNAMKLAEIVAGAVLAGEISLLASLSVGSLASAHKTRTQHTVSFVS